MPHPKRRLWTLGRLDRRLSFRLFFNEEAQRWDVEAISDWLTTGARIDSAERGGLVVVDGQPWTQP